MYTRSSVVGKAGTIDPEISPIPPLIYTGGQKVRNLASCSTSLIFERPLFENAARYLNSETNWVSTDDGRMFSRSLMKIGPRTPDNNLLPICDPVMKLTAKMCEIVNNSAADCWILLQFYNEFEHMMPERPQVFKVKGSKVKVIA